jgi:hypothetical protein
VDSLTVLCSITGEPKAAYWALDCHMSGLLQDFRSAGTGVVLEEVIHKYRVSPMPTHCWQRMSYMVRWV